MALPPWHPQMPADIAAMLAKGQTREAFKKGTLEISKEIARKGPRIIKPIGKIVETGLRRAGMFAEAEEVAIAGETLSLSTEATAALTAARLAAGWESIVGGAVIVAEAASPLLPLLMISLGYMFLLSLNSKPASAEPLKSREYQNLNREIKGAIDRRKYPFGIKPFYGNVH